MSSTSKLLKREKDDPVDRYGRGGDHRRRKDRDKDDKGARHEETYRREIEHRHTSTSSRRRHHSKHKEEQHHRTRDNRSGSSGRHSRSHGRSHRRHDRSESPKSRKRSRQNDNHYSHVGKEKSKTNDKDHRRYTSKRDADTGKSHVDRVKVDPTTLVPMGSILGNPPKTILDPEQDYFAYHDHLRLYLYRHKGQYFEDLTSEEARKAFVKFCSKYNKGKLEEGFYNEKELPMEAMEQCKRTKHKWTFATTMAEQKSLDTIKAGVKKQTLYNVKEVSKESHPPSSSSVRKVVIPPRDDDTRNAVIPPSMLASTNVPCQNSKDLNQQQQQQQREAILKSLGLGGLMSGKKIEIAPRMDDAP